MRRLAILLALLAGALNFLGLADHALWMPDEPREAEIAREFAEEGDWVLPRLNGGRWLEKPPLYHWIAAVLFRWAGEASPWLARLPSALAGLGIGLCAWLLARRLGLGAAAPWAAFLAWTSAELLNASHHAMVDALFSFWVTLALTGFAFGHVAPRGPSGRWDILTAGAAGLAFMTKFHLGPLLIGGAVLAWCLARRDWKPLKALLSPLPVLVFLAVAATWPVLLYMHEHQAGTGGEALGEILWSQLLRRTQGGHYGHAQPFYYYVPRLFSFAAPASLALLAALPWGIRRLRGDAAAAFPTAWILGAFVLLSLPSSKRAIYLTPCVAPAALLAAAWGREALARRPRMRWVLVGSAFLLIVGLIAAERRIVPEIDRRESFVPLAAELKRHAGGRVIEGFHLSENQQGAVAFALGRKLRCFTETRYLLDRLRMGDRVVLMPFARYEELRADPEAGSLIRLAGEAEAAGKRFAIMETVRAGP